MKHNQQQPEILSKLNLHQTVKNNTRTARHKQRSATPKYIYEIMREEDEEMSGIREEVREEEFAYRNKTKPEAEHARNLH